MSGQVYLHRRLGGRPARLIAAAVLIVSGIAAAEPDAAAKKRAADLSAESAAHYKRGEFEVSVALLRQAYALYPQPNLQYNLGRSLESMGDLAGAIDAYELYLSTAKQVEDRGAIERRISTLKAQLADRKKPESTTEPPPPSQPPLKLEPTAEPKSEPAIGPTRDPGTTPSEPTLVVRGDDGPSIAPWIVVGAGVAIAGTGAAFGVLALNAHASATSAMTCSFPRIVSR